MRIARLLLPLAAVAAAAVPAAALAARADTMAPVIVIKAGTLGKVLATPKHLGLYTWDTEKKAGGKVKCVASCATVWPPVIVAAGEKIPAHLKGVMEMLGTVKRPDGRTQLTVGGLPAYTFQKDTANVVLCDGTDGWHAIRA